MKKILSLAMSFLFAAVMSVSAQPALEFGPIPPGGYIQNGPGGGNTLIVRGYTRDFNGQHVTKTLIVDGRILYGSAQVGLWSCPIGQSNGSYVCWNYKPVVSGPTEVATEGRTMAGNYQGTYTFRTRHGLDSTYYYQQSAQIQVPAPIPCTPPTCNGSPIIVPLGKSPNVKISSVADGVYFDLDNNGTAERVAWPVGEAAFLVRDRNGDGMITNGAELYGNYTYFGLDENGFEALIREARVEGAEPPQWFDLMEPRNADVMLWHDSNRDGVSEASELTPARNLINRICLGYYGSGRRDGSGNEYRYRGYFEKHGFGGHVPVYDIWLETE